MLTIQRDTRELLAIGPGRFVECLGLFFCGIGLITITLPLISMVEKLEWTVPPELLVQAAMYTLTFGSGGVLMIFSQRRVIFHHERREIHILQGWRTSAVYRYSDVKFVTSFSSQGKDGMLCLLLENGARVLVTRGPMPHLHPLHTRIEQVLDLKDRIPAAEAPAESAQ
ncbi:MAG TPA: hypothetical protein VEK08_20355 [Planctomycetota bacterium]|nr:hypothetical protein [Planctomycetota bacterium]